MAHHGDYVCGRGCVSARRNSRTIPSVQNLQSGSFCPAGTLTSVILLKQNQDYILARILRHGMVQGWVWVAHNVTPPTLS